MTDGVDIDLYADVESEFQHDDFATENNDLYDDVLTAGSKVKKMSLLRMRDPGLFKPLDPGWKEIWIRDEHPRSFFQRSLGTIFRAKNTKFFHADQDPGSVIFLTLNRKFSSKKTTHNTSLPKNLRHFVTVCLRPWCIFFREWAGTCVGSISESSCHN
jgi:hypothetical protein